MSIHRLNSYWKNKYFQAGLKDLNRRNIGLSEYEKNRIMEHGYKKFKGELNACN